MLRSARDIQARALRGFQWDTSGMDQARLPESSVSRERIMDEAQALFAARGYRGLSMREIAEAVGISKAGIYYHFRDKEDLFAAIIHRYLAALAELIDAAQHAHGTARLQLDEIVRAILHQPAQERSLVRLASQEMAHLREAERSRFDTAYDALFIGKLRGLIAAGMARGELRTMDAQTATWALLGMLYPYFTPVDPNHARFPPEAVIDGLLAIYFDGLSIPAADI
jgi:AcrR family transcriptional regulator